MRICLLLALLLAGCPTGTPLTDDDDSTASDDDDSTVPDDDDSGDDDDSTAPALVDCAPPPIDDPPSDPADCNANGVLDADELIAGDAVDCNADGELDEYQQIDDACVTYGAREFVEYDAGNLPIVISAPHGGQVSPSDIPDRAAATGSSDVNTIQLARAVQAALYARTGRSAHLVICQLHRDKIDCNRSLGIAQDGHPETENAWFEYHAFIDAAKRSVEAWFGRGLYIDLHGLASSRDKNELGYLLYSGQLYEDDDRLAHPGYGRRSSMRTLAEGSGDFVEPFRGLTSLGAHLQAAGFDAVPSPAFPDPGYDSNGDPGNYFNGGYNTSRHGSRDGGRIDGLQIETMWAGVRDSEFSRAAFGEAVADGVLAWLETHHGLRPEARSLVWLGPVQGVASERGATAVLPVRSSGGLDAAVTVGLAWTGAAQDVTELPTTVTFDAGAAEVLVPIAARPDNDTEGPESVTVTLLPGTDANARSDADERTIRIVDAQAPGVWFAGDGTVDEGGTTELVLWRDTCGEPAAVSLSVGGEGDAADLGITAPAFGAEDASTALLIDGLPDGTLEGAETALLTATVDAATATSPLRIVDGDQDPDLLAWYDGRIADGRLVDSAATPVRADVLPDGSDGPQPATGPAGAALAFDEVDDMVIVDDLDLTGAFTVAFGFRSLSSSSDGFRYLYGHGNINQAHQLNIYLTDAGTLRTSIRGADDGSDHDALDVTGSYRDDSWHHYAVVVDPAGPSTTVYVDGVEAASAARGGSSFDPPHPIFLGSRWDLSPSRQFNGDLDEVMILGRGLTPTEVEALAAPFSVQE